MIEQNSEISKCTSNFLSTEQAKLVAKHISKETIWDERDGMKTQTYSKYQRFGSSSKTLELPLWAIMVANKLYYEKAVDFIPNEVTVVEHKEASIINRIFGVPGNAITIVLQALEEGRMVTLLFTKK